MSWAECPLTVAVTSVIFEAIWSALSDAACAFESAASACERTSATSSAVSARTCSAFAAAASAFAEAAAASDLASATPASAWVLTCSAFSTAWSDFSFAWSTACLMGSRSNNGSSMPSPVMRPMPPYSPARGPVTTPPPRPSSQCALPEWRVRIDLASRRAREAVPSTTSIALGLNSACCAMSSSSSSMRWGPRRCRTAPGPCRSRRRSCA